VDEQGLYREAEGPHEGGVPVHFDSDRKERLEQQDVTDTEVCADVRVNLHSLRIACYGACDIRNRYSECLFTLFPVIGTFL
jgi:hypothetical protein